MQPTIALISLMLELIPAIVTSAALWWSAPWRTRNAFYDFRDLIFCWAYTQVADDLARRFMIWGFSTPGPFGDYGIEVNLISTSIIGLITGVIVGRAINAELRRRGIPGRFGERASPTLESPRPIGRRVPE
ncbi:hypothetical protein [Mitsuaria sp. GD03876]|uniref:hypothetical protein n=1 Tax=Mitsuaria sp. GD03876 TaxID=2975399 RepID=UPI00244AE637|nr:hypothetical protein [Mitsuaria sp. GD03876]MDH0865155.1 hypothetical protein [Mitsuaria sp. GD03876]